MHVKELWRYPIKSVGGERLDTARIGELGIDGDRRWGVFDVATGTVLTARRTPELLFASARLDGGELVLTLPVVGDIGEADASVALTEWLGRTVELRAAGAEGGTYEAPLDFERDENWVSWTGPAGAWHDSKWSRVSIVSTATLGEWDIRRFRTNIVIDGDGEDEFVGDHILFGERDTGVEVAVFKPIDRCVMVTRPQPGLERDLGVLKQIIAERANNLSVGGLIAVAGTVSVGDEVVSLGRPSGDQRAGITAP